MTTLAGLDRRTGRLGTAVFSIDGLRRYWLDRPWGQGKTVLWIMCNPSDADHERNDPTIVRTICFAKREGGGSEIVVNPFSYITKDPRRLLEVEDPVGPENAAFLKEARAKADLAIAAWGVLPKKLSELAATQLLSLGVLDLYCLGMTKWGAPRHPLYLARTTPLVPWKP